MNELKKKISDINAWSTDIHAANTEENFERLNSLATKLGCNLKRNHRGVSGYTFTNNFGQALAGITLLDAARVVKKIAGNSRKK